MVLEGLHDRGLFRGRRERRLREAEKQASQLSQNALLRQGVVWGWSARTAREEVSKILKACIRQRTGVSERLELRAQHMGWSCVHSTFSHARSHLARPEL